MAQPPNKARDEDVWLPAHRDDRGPLDGASNHLSVDAKNDDLSTEGWAANYQSAGEGQRLLGQLETAAHWLRGALRVDPDARAAVAVGTFAAGIIGYFHLPREPALGVMLATLILLLALFLRTRARGGLTGMRVAAAGCLLLAGAVLAQLQVLKVQSPMLAKPVTVRVTATVLFAELRADGRQRVDLLLHSAERADAKTLPKKVRLVLRQEALLPAGATVTGLARLMPHTGPAYPGGYDFGFGHYFEGRGALGFSMGTFELATDADPVALSWMMQAKIIQSQLRSVLAARIREGLPGEAGHVAVALITGERQAISDETNESLRASGMAHILAISGLHMTLIVGSIFFGLRFAMALHPTWPLRYPTKKFAAAAALAVATAYLAISGAGLATQRAYITLAVMLVALLLDRRAISLRNVAVAAAIVLVMQPHAIFLAGFQMSFAAVASLVASYRAFGKLRERAEVLAASGLPLRGRDALIARWFGASHGVHQRSWWQEGLQWCLRFFAGIALTSLIAGLGTGLFAAWHFHRVAPMGLLANLLAMPFVTVAVMPGLLTAMFSLPFGLDPIFLGGAGRGIETVQSIASWSANIGPHGRTGAMPLSVFLVCLAGLAAAICLRGAAKLVAAPIATAGIMVWSLGVVTIDPPEVLISSDRGLVAVRKDASNYQLNSARSQAFTRDLWLRAYAPSVGPGDQLATMQCDAHGCFARSEHGMTVSWAKTPEALREDCAKVDLVVTKLVTRENCIATIVNPETEGGALAINAKMETQAKGTNRVHIRTANALVHRPWNRRTEMAFQPSRPLSRD